MLVALVACVMSLAPGSALAAGVAEASPAASSLRVGFVSSMFTDVNEMDAKAGVKVWAATVAKERGIAVDPDPQIFKHVDDLAEALRNNQVDVAGLNTVEYLKLEPEGLWGTIFSTTVGGTLIENYIILVQRDGEYNRAADLGGKTVLYLDNVRTCLARPWLENLVRAKGHGTAEQFFGDITPKAKLAKVLLPVFFGQADACLVTRKGFDTMAELNPQIGRDLKILETSIDVMPAVFAFRKSYDAPVKGDVLAGLRDLHESAAGRQVLTVFQSERLVEQPSSVMDSARRILAGHCDPASDPGRAGSAGTGASDKAATSGGLR